MKLVFSRALQILGMIIVGAFYAVVFTLVYAIIPAFCIVTVARLIAIAWK